MSRSNILAAMQQSSLTNLANGSSSGNGSNAPSNDFASSSSSSSSQKVSLTQLSEVVTTASPEKPALPPRPPPFTVAKEIASLPSASASQFSSSLSTPVYSQSSVETTPSITVDGKPPLPARPRQLKIGQSDISLTSDSTGYSRATIYSHRVTDKSAVYPDSTDANRRPPLSNLLRQDIQVKSSVKSIASSRGYVCIGHHAIKIVDASTGEPVAVSQQKPECRVTALAFVPSLDIERDRRYFWAGFHDGDLWMLDCRTGDVLERRISAHSHPINHILRFRRQLWTIDEHGVLQIWFEPHPQAHLSDQYASDMISLEGRPKTFRIAAKQAFAIVVGAHLWSARDKLIEVVSPMEEANMHKKRIDIPGNYAAITCLTCCESPIPAVYSHASPTTFPFSLHDSARYRVFTGHMDGKILEWDSVDFSKKRVIDLGSYRIASLVAANDRHLWSGIGTGKISIMDVGAIGSAEPIAVLKEWQAETNDSIEFFALERDSMVHTGEQLLVTCSKGGHVQLWNATLEDDFIGRTFV